MRRMRHIKAREFQGCDVAYDFSNPASLYDATSGGSLVAADGAIARANDLSGGSGHMTQATSGYRPLRKTAALNGMDIGRFDGSDDYLNAGDVGDTLASPITAFVVVKKTQTTGLYGVFGKNKYGTLDGRWGILVNGKDEGMFGDAAAGSVAEPGFTGSTAAQILVFTVDRVTGSNAAKAKLVRNGGAASNTVSYTDTGTSRNNTKELLLGAYNGDGTVTQAGTFMNGDIGEAAKWSAILATMPLARFMASRSRKWRIY